MSKYSYVTEIEVLLSDSKEPIVISDMFRNIQIGNDYDRLMFPFLSLTTTISAESYYLIQQDKDVKFSITIKKYNMSDLEQNNKNIFSYYIKNKIFIPFDKDLTPFDLLDNPEDKTGSPDVPMVQTTYVLVSEEDFTNNKKLVNSVLSQVDVGSAVLYLANRFTSKPIIFQEPDNEKIYNQIIFPPNNIIRSMMYLDNVYGIYNSGLRLFFDLNAYYIINKTDNKDVGLLENDHKDMYINVYGDNNIKSDSLAYDEMDIAITPDNNKFYSASVHIDDVRFINYEDSKREFIGTNNIIVSQSTKQLNCNVYGTDELKTRVFYNRYDNPFKEKELLVEGRKGHFIVVTLDNVDINAIACNHQFFIQFFNERYKQYNGEYHIIKSENNFISGQTGVTGLQTKLYFKKK